MNVSRTSRIKLTFWNSQSSFPDRQFPLIGLSVCVCSLKPGNNSVFHVRNYMTSEDIKQHGGLHVILDAMHVKDSGHTGRKQLLKYLWPAVSTPFQTAFAITGGLLS